MAGKLKLGAFYGRVACVARDVSDYHCDIVIFVFFNYNTFEVRELLEELVTSHVDAELRAFVQQALSASEGIIHIFMGMELASEE